MGKICIYCNQDCSGRPRLKDDQGRYACKACAEQHGAAPARPVPATATAGQPPANVLDDAAEGGAGSYALAEPAEVGAVPTQRLCPACSRALAPEAVICTSCGYDTRKGFQIGSGVGADSRTGGRLVCRKCGYSLKGLKTNKCPECGEVATAPTYSERRQKETRKQTINAYRTPAIVLVVGAGLVLFALSLAANKYRVPFEDALVWYGVEFAISVPTALVAFGVAGVLWLGFNAPIFMLILQFCATIMLSDAAYYFVRSGISVRTAAWAASMAVFYFTLIVLMEFDPEDGAIFLAIVWITSVIMRMTVAPMILEAMGYAYY